MRRQHRLCAGAKILTQDGLDECIERLMQACRGEGITLQDLLLKPRRFVQAFANQHGVSDEYLIDIYRHEIDRVQSIEQFEPRDPTKLN